MTKISKNIASGFEDAIAYMKGDKSRAIETIYTVPDVNVKAVRMKMGLSQEEFSKLFAIKNRTLQDWEQHRRKPGTPARILLAIIYQHPKTVKRTLTSLGYPISQKLQVRISKSRKKHKKTIEGSKADIS